MLDEPQYVGFIPLINMTDTQRKEFEAVEFYLFPEVGSRMMTRMFTGQDLLNGWVIMQDGVYRYSVTQGSSGIRVRTVMFEYLATNVFWS